MRPHCRHIALAATIVGCVALTSCDSGFSGAPYGNEPPQTALSVRDESLLDNLGDGDRLLSTIRLTWSGDDPDGFVIGYEVRTHDDGVTPTGDEGWRFTAANDSLLLLPIPPGSASANVVVEVRAVDDDELRDPTPARSVFPIRNSPPLVRLSQFELPPDTTFTVVSFAWRAQDPDGDANLASVGISLNDSTSFVELPPDIDFVTLVADRQPGSAASVVDAKVFLGRGTQVSALRVPGMRLDDENVFYLRATDQADTTSAVQSHAWHVKAVTGDVLYVNDYRLESNPVVLAYHLGLLRDYLPAGHAVNTWDVTLPYTTGSSGTVPRSSALPPVAEPMLRMTFTLFKHIYWVSSSTVGSVGTDNMPFVAPALTEFFENGGRMLVVSPVNVSTLETDFTDNAAVLLLPLSRPLVLPDSVGRIELRPDALVRATDTGRSLGLPDVVSQRFFINVRPFEAVGANIQPLYEGAFTYRSIRGSSGTWTDPTTLASISADRRVALLAIPVVNDITGEQQFRLADGSAEPAGGAVLRGLLTALEFPR